jgi:hypothetical protein
MPTQALKPIETSAYGRRFRMHPAVEAARSARFEHGEAP